MTETTWPPGRPATMRLAAIAAALIVGGLVLWLFAELLLLVFAAVLVAILLSSLARLIGHRTPLGERGSLALAGLLIGLALAGFVALLGAQIWLQANELVDRLPELKQTLEERYGLSGFLAWVSEEATTAVESTGFLSSLAGYSSLAVSAIAHLLLVVVGGVYLALRPQTYRRGLLLLFPPRLRADAAETIDQVGGALELWLLGQLLAMVLVGTLTALGLWLLGVPSPFALGLLAGLAEFVPVIGPVVAAVPAIAVALAESGTLAIWVVVLFVVITQVEGNLITPLVQRSMVDLPPALTLFAIVAFGLLFGVLGVLLATPLAVFSFVLVKKLWVRDALGEDVDIPGED